MVISTPKILSRSKMFKNSGCACRVYNNNGCVVLKTTYNASDKNQWEQEYLAKHLSSKGFYIIDKPEDIKNYLT